MMNNKDKPASQSANEPEQWLHEELIENASRGMSSTELLSFCAEFERRIRADEREKCEAHTHVKTYDDMVDRYEAKLAAARASIQQAGQMMDDVIKEAFLRQFEELK